MLPNLSGLRLDGPPAEDIILKNDLGKPPIKQFYDFAVLGANYPISRPRSEQSR